MFDTFAPASRRQFLARNAMGIGSVALAWLLKQERLLAMPANVRKAPPTFDLKPKAPHHPPQAQAMISLFMHGGPSHMDLTDPKPQLTKYSGTDYSGDVAYSFVSSASKKLMGTPFRFRKHGECGTELSELLPHTAKIVDDICLVRSMHTDINGHEAVDLVSQHRSGPAGTTCLRLVAHLWPGVGEPEPARLRRHARSGRHAGRRRSQLVQRLDDSPVPGDRRSVRRSREF